MNSNSSTTQAAPIGIAPLANIAIAERAISRALGRGLHQPGLVVMHGPSGYGKSMSWGTWSWFAMVTRFLLLLKKTK